MISIVRARSGTGHTAVTWAAAVGNVEALSVLLDHGGDVGWSDSMQVWNCSCAIAFRAHWYSVLQTASAGLIKGAWARARWMRSAERLALPSVLERCDVVVYSISKTNCNACMLCRFSRDTAAWWALRGVVRRHRAAKVAPWASCALECDVCCCTSPRNGCHCWKHCTAVI